MEFPQTCASRRAKRIRNKDIGEELRLNVKFYVISACKRDRFRHSERVNESKFAEGFYHCIAKKIRTRDRPYIIWKANCVFEPEIEAVH
jgi:hypothetical protein